MVDQEANMTEAPNTYEFSLTVLNNKIVDINVTSSNITSSWMKMIAVTVGSFLIIMGMYGKNFIEMYHMLVK